MNFFPLCCVGLMDLKLSLVSWIVCLKIKNSWLLAQNVSCQRFFFFNHDFYHSWFFWAYPTVVLINPVLTISKAEEMPWLHIVRPGSECMYKSDISYCLHFRLKWWSSATCGPSTTSAFVVKKWVKFSSHPHSLLGPMISLNGKSMNGDYWL